ncbi:MAG TPA: hypothetical protein VG756_12135 [Pseudonocardiaceae bacterium]|jgi:hypothetical protein|nr:hypothetical protein [Pseudonocardiaceae bacterium]
MSTSYHIHVRPSDSTIASNAEGFRAEVAAVLGAPLAPSVHGYGWTARSAAGVVEVFTEFPLFDDEPGIPFSRYPWYVEMARPRVDEVRNREVLARMWAIYDALVATGRYCCCFVHEFSTLLATNDIAVTGSPV